MDATQPPRRPGPPVRHLSDSTYEIAPHDGRIVPDWNPVTSEHFWLVSTVYRVNPERAASGLDGPTLLDRENLVTVTPVYCYHCEQVWNAEIGGDPCDGEPADEQAHR